MRTQTFGIEIETTGLGRQRTAEVIAKHFGTTAQYIGAHLDDWKIPMHDGRKWTVESDGSVTDPSAEVVSPVCRWEDIETVQEVVRALRNLVNIVNAKEDLLTQALGISYSRRERWCKPVEPTFLEALNRRKPATMDTFAELSYKHSGGSSYDWRRCAGRHYDHSRYHLLNLHATFSSERPARTIEFRAFNATLHAGEIKSYIQLCLAVSAQALHSKSASSTRPETDNPKYTFRCWLLRLGFIGEEFETARMHLTKRLPGNAAWRRAA